MGPAKIKVVKYYKNRLLKNQFSRVIQRINYDQKEAPQDHEIPLQEHDLLTISTGEYIVF